MQIKDMFRKKIDREIQGVIIVGQGEETNVAQELEEYVVTRELQRHFADFFAAYLHCGGRGSDFPVEAGQQAGRSVPYPVPETVQRSERDSACSV